MTLRIASRSVVLGLLGFVLQSTVGLAQPLGTFRWQLQPFCNVLTINATQSGGVYTLDGFDDLCGSVTKATAVGIAFPKSDGTLGMGLTLVLPGGAAPLHITTSISPSTASGSWQDSGGNSGTFLFNPSNVAGATRPVTAAVFLSGLSAGNHTIVNLAPPVNASDAATKAYVDSSIASSSLWLSVTINGVVAGASPALAGTTVFRATGFPGGFWCIRFPPGLSVQSHVAVGSVQQAFAGAGVAPRMAVTRSLGECGTNSNVAVQTYTPAGALADLPFMLFIPR